VRHYNKNTRVKNVALSVFSFIMLIIVSAGIFILFSENVNSILNGEKDDLKTVLALSKIPDDVESEVEDNDSYKKANKISVNVEYKGNLCDSYSNGEEDWYRFSLPKGGSISYTIKTIDQDDDTSYWNPSIRRASTPEERIMNDYISGDTVEYTSGSYYMSAGDYYFEFESSNKYSSDIYIFMVNYDDSSEMYTGSYIYNNVLTNLNLVVRSNDWKEHNNIIATFNFGANSINPDNPRGSFYMDGYVLDEYSDGTLNVRFKGREWYEQPSGYEMLDFTAIVDKQNGTIISDDYELNLIREDLLTVEEASYKNNIIEFDGHKYCYFSNSLSWNNAEKFCEKIGGHLVSVNSAEEQDFVQEIASTVNKDNLWLGGYLDGDTWKWTDGSEFSYSNWDAEKPDNYLGNEAYTKFPCDDFEFEAWSAHRGKWDDVSLTADGRTGDVPLSSFGFICEWET